MTDEALYNLAKVTSTRLLNNLDEIRAKLHNELLDAFKIRGMRFHHRDDITQWAYRMTGRIR